MTANSPAIVYVHGISEHGPGYSDAWHASLEPHLSHAVEKHEVRWSEIVNALGRAIDAASETLAAGGKVNFVTDDESEQEAEQLAAEEDLREEIAAELALRAAQNGQANRKMANHSEKLIYGASGFGFAFDDFVRYMVWEATRNDILAKFDEIVVPLLRDGRALNIIAHSWGAVVSYEGLRRLDNAGLPGRVANLIVLGSALSIGPVQRNLLGRVTDGRMPKLVRNFVNIDAGGDIVGGDIAPPFDVTDQFLNQKPTGCSTFWIRRNTARSFTCAHSSYFQSENTAVQRDIVARCINQSLA